MDMSELILAVLVILFIFGITLLLRQQASPISNTANNNAAELANTIFNSPGSAANVSSYNNCDVDIGTITQKGSESFQGKQNVHLATNTKGKVGPIIQTLEPNSSKVTKEKQKRYPTLISTKDGKRGICLILNYFKYPKEKDEDGNSIDMNRYGTGKDAQDLKNLFTSLQFEVQLKTDLTKTETIKKLKEVAALDHSEYTCFILIILAHGVPDNIVIGKELLSYETIKDAFEYGIGKASQSLATMPKLFFIQACQGELLDSGRILPQVLVNGNCSKDSNQLANNQTPSCDSDNSRPSYQTLVTDSALEVISSGLHRFSFISSYASRLSVRLPQSGTWFIQELVAVFKEHARDTDLVDLCNQVKERVSKKTAVQQFETENDQGRLVTAVHFIKQTPETRSTLQKAVFFF